MHSEKDLTPAEAAEAMKEKQPSRIPNPEYRFDSFSNGKVLLHKKKGHLPAMGWNSWNAFGSGNTEALTKAMADKMIELGLDRLGYRYLVLDDGCYRPVREDGLLVNEKNKFPNGFKSLSDYIHSKGLKFGMYNDIGTQLCSGAKVGTCGFEKADAQSYVDWGIDFIKVDNCYYLWDDATFSDRANARYVYAPNIRGIRITGASVVLEKSAAKDGILLGNGAVVKVGYVTSIGTFDGTGPDHTPIGLQSGELAFSITVPEAGDYKLVVTYATGQEPCVGGWLQLAVGSGETAVICYDDFLPPTKDPESFTESPEITLPLQAGENLLRLMNHRRQENTLCSYAALLEGLTQAAPDHDIIFSLCEWGKTQPQNWGYKVGDSWRILNDITFRVGSDGDPGFGAWTDGYTPSVTSQYNKAVIMDEFAGLDKGWNDPDMLMLGMKGLTEAMMKTHMTMWCMMNAPLMLGLDLRRVEKGDSLWKLIANEALIALNQDALGIPAKRLFTSVPCSAPDTDYIRDNNRVDILVKPLADGSVAISFVNVSEERKTGEFCISVDDIAARLGHKLIKKEAFLAAKKFQIVDVWTGIVSEKETGRFRVEQLEACDNVTIRVTPV